MALPSGMSAFILTFGSAAVLGADETLGMRITVTAATSAIWTATGQPFLFKKQTATAATGESGSITLINPDQGGFANADGATIRNWTYGIHIDYLDAGGNTVTSADKNLAYLTSMGNTIDLDLTIPVSTTAGVVVSVPGGFTLPAGGTNGQVLGLVNGVLGWVTVTGSSSNTTITNTAAPTITGTAVTGNVLTATNGTWTNSPTNFGYQWTRASVPIAGATAATYTLTGTDVGQAVAVTVTASRTGYTAGAMPSAAVTPVAATGNGTLSVTDNGDGTTTRTGTGVTDNGDGTATINSTAATDNGDGTYTLVA